jgi:hypothetical protein
MLSNLILRRTILLGTPLVVAIDVMFLHPVLDGDVRVELFPVADLWLTLHVVQLVLFGLMGLTVYLLLDGLSGIVAAIGRLAVAVFVVFYNAGDAVAGIATGIIARGAIDLPAGEQVAVAQAIAKLFADPTKHLIFMIGSYAWSVGLLATAVALYRAGAPRLPLVPLAVAGVPYVDFSGVDHSPPFDPLALALFFLAVLWLEFTRRKYAPAGVESSADRAPLPDSG